MATYSRAMVLEGDRHAGRIAAETKGTSSRFGGPVGEGLPAPYPGIIMRVDKKDGNNPWPARNTQWVAELAIWLTLSPEDATRAP